MIDPVTVGTALLAHIEPHPGQARAFNAWYERDHFYANAMAGPGMYAGARWVATRACKRTRLTGDLLGGSYLATYWILPDRQAEWDEWSAREYARTPPDRLFAGRDHVHTGIYRFVFDLRTEGAPPPATALDHGFAGVVEVGGNADEVEEWAHHVLGPDVPLVMVFASQRTVLSDLNPGDHYVALGFCPDDPLTVPLPETAGFASAYIATVPGTDRYVDDL